MPSTVCLMEKWSICLGKVWKTAARVQKGDVFASPLFILCCFILQEELIPLSPYRTYMEWLGRVVLDLAA